MGRYDANDNMKHMGLILISPKGSNTREKMTTISYKHAERNEDIQIQGIIVRMKNGLAVGFLYCRSTPSAQEIKAIQRLCRM